MRAGSIAIPTMSGQTGLRSVLDWGFGPLYWLRSSPAQLPLRYSCGE